MTAGAQSLPPVPSRAGYKGRHPGRRPENLTGHFHSRLMIQNLVTWLHVAARESGKWRQLGPPSWRMQAGRSLGCLKGRLAIVCSARVPSAGLCLPSPTPSPICLGLSEDRTLSHSFIQSPLWMRSGCVPRPCLRDPSRTGLQGPCPGC